MVLRVARRAGSSRLQAWEDFVQKMKCPEAQDLRVAVRTFVGKVERCGFVDSRAKREMDVFVSAIMRRVAVHTLWAQTETTEAEAAEEPNEQSALQNVKSGFEKLIMIKLYNQLFSSMESARARDRKLSDTIERLQFLQPKHLDIPEGALNDSSMDLAIREISRIDSFKPPTDKMVCILNACQIVSEILSGSQPALDSGCRAPSADDFLPILIYVLVKAKPKNPFLNIQFVSTFSNADDLRSIKGYMFTHMASALTFLENVSAPMLNIDPEEFERLMTAPIERESSEPSLSSGVAVGEAQTETAVTVVNRLKATSLKESAALDPAVLTFASHQLEELRVGELPILLEHYKSLCRFVQETTTIDEVVSESISTPSTASKARSGSALTSVFGLLRLPKKG